ncbi:hypothetical protein Sjap_007434 [Stephania japonica]|uniref:Uncharacterized protein n=1 Tax=Stephania japonica TaxID=461633 RepID=A0AAP0PDQ5_9MAGN
MAVSFKYWDECLDPQDLEALWGDPEVSKQRIGVGEDRGQKVHLSRDPDGQPYLTQTKMKTLERILDTPGLVDDYYLNCWTWERQCANRVV